MNKILVTGGAGFIGSNLCEHLVQNGYNVVCLDNFSIGHMSNIQHLLNGYESKFTLIEGDIRNFETCLKATQGVDAILHEAALESIPRSINDSITTNDVNIGGFLNMLWLPETLALNGSYSRQAVLPMETVRNCQKERIE